jgi:hypothetical protein
MAVVALSENTLSRGDKKRCRNLYCVVALCKRIYAFLVPER